MKTTFTTGNFELEIEGELNSEQAAAAQEAGLRYIVQRDVATEVYKQVAGEKNKNDKLQLPKDFERSSIEYSPETAKQFETAAETALGKYGTFAVVVSEHVAGETAAPRAMATAMWEQVKSNDALRGNLGVAKDASDEVGIEACHKFLAGLRKTPQKKAA